MQQKKTTSNKARLAQIGTARSVPFVEGAFLGDISNLGSGTSQLIPLVKIAPRCPPEAALAGINGEVLLNLLVNASGRVEQIRLVKANPPRIFNREATKAVRRWQFVAANFFGGTTREVP